MDSVCHSPCVCFSFGVIESKHVSIHWLGMYTGMDDPLGIEFVPGVFKKHLADISILLTDCLSYL